MSQIHRRFTEEQVRVLFQGYCQYRLLRTPLRTKAVGTVLKVGFKDRLDHDLARLLHHPVAYRRYPQRPSSTIRLGNVNS